MYKNTLRDDWATGYRVVMLLPSFLSLFLSISSAAYSFRGKPLRIYFFLAGTGGDIGWL